MPRVDEHWSRQWLHCRNCATTRRRHKGRGYCGLCYRAISAIEVAEKWDRSRRDTLIGVPQSGIHRPDGTSVGLATDSLTREAFERFRAAYVEEHRRRLADLRSRERTWRGENVDGLSVEYQLRRLVNRFRPGNKRAFYGRASILRKRFGPAGLVALAQLLEEIDSLIPWRLNWGAVYEATYRLGGSRAAEPAGPAVGDLPRSRRNA